MVVVESTSGSTGIGLAQAAVVRGLSCAIVIPGTASVERRQVLAALGATVVLSPAREGIPGVIAAAEQLLARLGERAWIPRQTTTGRIRTPTTARPGRRSGRTPAAVSTCW